MTFHLHATTTGSIQSWEFQVDLRSPLPTVSATYIDIDRWRNRGVVSEVSWVEGKPWKPGSRIRVEVSEPVHAVVEQVLSHFENNCEIAYTGHVFGMTFNTHLSFSAISESESVIRVVMELAGKSWRLFNFAIEPTLETITLRFFEDLKRDCEWAAFQAKKASNAAQLIPETPGQSSQP